MLREVIARFREAWAALPTRARRRWFGTVAVGFLLLVVLMALVERAGQRLAAAGAFRGEADALVWIAAEAPVSFSSAVWVQTLGTDITLVLIVLVASGIAAWVRRPLAALSILGAYVLLDPVIRLGWLMWERARPTVILEGIASPGFASFPSGHTAKSLAVYGLLAWIWARASRSPAERIVAVGIAVLILAFVMLGRLRMGVHWPSDVVAGVLMGGAWLSVLVAALWRADAAAAKPG